MLTDQNKAAVKEFLDWCVPLQGIPETISDIAINIGVNVLDSKVLDKVNPKYHSIINEIITHALVEEDYEQANVKASILLADAVDTPVIDGTPEEQQTYYAALNLLVAVIRQLLEKKKNQVQ